MYELIDRKLLIRRLRDLQMGKFSTIGYKREYDFLDMIIRGVEDQPVAYNVDKVVENVKRIGTALCVSAHCGDECQDCEYGNIMKSIVKEIETGGNA